MTDHSTLERRLRDAADPSVWNDVAPDAWQENERRVAADHARRGGRRLRVIAAAAAVVVVVGGGILVSSRFNGSPLAPSAGGADGRPGPSIRTGRCHPVELERLTTKGSTFVHTAFLTRAGGKGVSLCDTYASSANDANRSSSCTATSLDPAHQKANAFAYLTAGNGGDLKGVTGAVVPRVVTLRAWVGDSAEPRVLPLHALGFNGLQAFGVTTLGAHAPVVRIGAYDAKGALLQVVDAPSIFGAGWLPNDPTCAHPKIVGPPLPPRQSTGSVDTVEAATSSMRLSGIAGSDSLCVSAPSGEAVTAARQGQWVVVVTAPELETLGVQVGKQTTRRTPTRYPGTPWGIVMIRNDNPKESVVLDPRGAGNGKLGPEHYYVSPTS